MLKTILPRLPIACLALALACCTTPEEPPSGPGAPHPIDQPHLGTWVEIPPEGVMRFAGEDFTFEFDYDSLRILEHRFTDAVGCEIQEDYTRRCSDLRWTNTYGGIWRLTGSTLRLDYRFAGTTASPLTANPIPPDGWVEFKLSLEGPLRSQLVMRPVGGRFISHRQEIRLERIPGCHNPPLFLD